jgi:hypothetical protein
MSGRQQLWSLVGVSAWLFGLLAGNDGLLAIVSSSLLVSSSGGGGDCEDGREVASWRSSYYLLDMNV